MKKVLRNLSIEERKVYYNTICYTLFHCISSFIIEILLDYYKISLYSITSHTGSLMCILSLIKIILSIKGDKNKREKVLDTINLKKVMFISLLYALNFFFMIFSMKYSRISTFYIILRMATFFKLFFLYIIYNEYPQSFQIYSGIIITCCIVLMYFFPYSQETFIGLAFCLSFSFNYAIIILYHWNISKVKSEVVSFFMGLVLSSIGGFLMIVNGDDLENFSFSIWIYIIILSFLNFHIVYFQAKTLVLKIVSQLIPFKFISVFFSFVLSIFILKERITLFEFLLSIVIFITMYIYSKKIKETTLAESNHNGSCQNSINTHIENK